MTNNIYKRIASLIRKIDRRSQYIIGSTKGNLIKVYWWKGTRNFGDFLTPALLRKYGLTPLHSPLSTSDAVCVGSILQDLPEDYSGYIIGAGLICDMDRRFPNAKILAVRGELTKKRLGAPENTILGDPGLLSYKLLAGNRNKEYLIGFVPHYVDKLDQRIQKIYQNNKKEVLIIDVQCKPKEVISEIDKCRFIISSSLHGIVVADSLGIPNAWMSLSDRVVGNGFKFQDYASAFGMNLEPHSLSGSEHLKDLINMTHEVPEEIQAVKNNLDSIFSSLKQTIINKQKI